MQKWERLEEDFVKNYVYKKRNISERIHNFGHRAVENLRSKKSNQVVLDLASGPGSHFRFLDADRLEIVFALDAKRSSLESSRDAAQFDCVNTLIQGDCYSLPFQNDSLDQVFSLYAMEHILDLDRCFSEVSRVLRKGGGFYIGIPTEGGLLWRFGRTLTTARVARQRYGVDYNKIIREEHVSTAFQILKKIPQYFQVRRTCYFPFGVPSIHLNLVVVLEAVKQ